MEKNTFYIKIIFDVFYLYNYCNIINNMIKKSYTIIISIYFD